MEDRSFATPALIHRHALRLREESRLAPQLRLPVLLGRRIKNDDLETKRLQTPHGEKSKETAVLTIASFPGPIAPDSGPIRADDGVEQLDMRCFAMSK